MNQLNWDRYETALLIEAHERVTKGGCDRKKELEKLAENLRRKARLSGLEIDEKYRNANGMRFQFDYVTAAFRHENIGKRKPPRLFTEMTELYVNDRDAFTEILREAHRLCGTAEQGQKKPEADMAAETSGKAYAGNRPEAADRNGQRGSSAAGIKRKIQGYLNDSGAVRRKLQRLQETLDDGRAPAKPELKEFSQDADRLRDRYDEVFQEVCALMPPGEQPAPERPILEYGQIAERQSLARLCGTLRRFIRVYSDKEIYGNALTGYQAEAQGLLARLESGDAATDSEAPGEGIAKTAAVFLQALDTDPDTDEGQELLDALGEYFPRRVERGLSGHHYFCAPAQETVPVCGKTEGKALQGGGTADAQAQPAEAPAVSETSRQDHTETSVSLTEDSAESKETEREIAEEAGRDMPPELETGSDGVQPAGVTADACAEAQRNDAAEPRIGKETEPDACGEPAKAVEEHADACPEEGEMLSPVNKIRTGKPNGSAFLKKVSEVNVTGCLLFSTLSVYAVATKEQIHSVAKFMHQLPDEDGYLLEDAVSRLVANGCLAEFQYGDIEAYALAPWSYACLQKQDVKRNKRFSGIGVGSHEFLSGSQISRKSLESVLETNQKIIGAFVRSESPESDQDREYLVYSVFWDKDRYCAGLMRTDDRRDGLAKKSDKDIAKKTILCQISTDGSFLAPEKEENILLLCPETVSMVNTEPMRQSFKGIFALRDGKIVSLFPNEGTQGGPDRKEGSLAAAAGAAEAETAIGADTAVRGAGAGQGRTEAEEPAYENDGDPAEEKTAAEGDVFEESPEENAAAAGDDDAAGPAEAEKDAGGTAAEAIKEGGEKNTDASRGGTKKEDADERAEGARDGEAYGEGTPVNGFTEMSERADTPAEDEFLGRIAELLDKAAEAGEDDGRRNDCLSGALMLARAAAFVPGYGRAKRLSEQLQLAMNVKPEDLPYDGETLRDLFDGTDVLGRGQYPALLFSAYSFALLRPAKKWDHALSGQAESLFAGYESNFPGLEAMKPVFNRLNRIQTETGVEYGYSVRAVQLLKGMDEDTPASLREKAKQCLNPQPPKAQLGNLPEMYQRVIGTGSALYGCMEEISQGSTDQETDELLLRVLREFCEEKDDVFTVQQRKLDDYIDEEWRRIDQKKHGKLIGLGRKKILDEMETRLNIINEWHRVIEEKNRTVDIQKLKDYREKILRSVRDAEEAMREKNGQGSAVLRWAFYLMEAELTGEEEKERFGFFSDVAKTGILSQDDSGSPVLEEPLQKVSLSEPWRLVLRHIGEPRRDSDPVLADIADYRSPLFDNLHQRTMLERYASGASSGIGEEEARKALSKAESDTETFTQELEVAYAYGQISEAEKENISEIISRLRQVYFDRKDYACWRQLLGSQKRYILLCAEKEKRKLTERWAKACEKDESAQILKTVRELLDTNNLTLAEEYLNRFDCGQCDLPPSAGHTKDFLADFFGRTDEIYNVAKNNGKHLRIVAGGWLSKQLEGETSRNRDYDAMLDNWAGKSEDQIRKLFTWLGLDVREVKTVLDQNGGNTFEMALNATPRNRADYTHPISAFGTNVRNPVTVAVRYGNVKPEEALNIMSGLDRRGISVLIVDGCYSVSDRRRMAEQYYTKMSGQSSFLVIDRVLALYIALQGRAERLEAFLKCTLPFTRYQPFVKGAGHTDDEMFFGRRSELNTITDRNGACFVYGGRQLGKTALLRRAESRYTDRDRGCYGVYVDIKGIRAEEDFVCAARQEIEHKIGPDRIPAGSGCNTMEKFRLWLRELYDKNLISGLLLLIDEADDLLAAMSGDGYEALQPLIRLWKNPDYRFKFVLAGLHNVCRAEHAMSQNGPLGQVPTLCVKPMSSLDAQQLLIRPLSYLGFRFNDDSALMTILTQTNYYPGILQLVGYELVETLPKQYQNGEFTVEDENPPYMIQDKQLRSVIEKLNDGIKDKFNLSRKLDPRYDMIALCIAYLYHDHAGDMDTPRGYSVKELREVASAYGASCLCGETDDSIGILMDEMADMGILLGMDNGLYRLRRRSFLDYIGADWDSLVKEIESKSGGNPDENA